MPLRYLKNVVTLGYDPEKCTGCGMCVEVCPHAVFVMEGKNAALTDRDLCMECGACLRNCPFGAISVRPGVGCAYALMMSQLRGREITCGD
jgi:ferredoxin